MLKGRFGDTSGRPYIESILIIPSLGIRVPISFLVDTGADTTTLAPADIAIIGLDVSEIPLVSSQCVGIGGDAECHEVAAIVVFSDDTHIYSYNINLSVLAPVPGTETIPSLLGRDVLDNWAMTYDPSRNRLEFVVRRADLKSVIDP